MPRELLFKRDGDFDPNEPKSLLNWALWLKGKTLRDSFNRLPVQHQAIAKSEIEKIAEAKIMTNGSYQGPKGKLGIVTEIIHFGLSPDNAPLADLRGAGLELKVTGLLKNTRGIRAKERLSLGMIDYSKYVKTTPDFESDQEVQKSLSGMLLMTYWYKSSEQSPLDVVFHDSLIWKPTGQERELIKQDWAILQATIRLGFAHMLSERYSNGLGAPPKGAGKDSDFIKQPVQQPFTYKQLEDEMVALGVEEKHAKYVATDYQKRTKVPGDGIKGYTLPKDKSLISKIGPYPARRRCYSLTNSYLTKLINKKPI